MNQLQSTLTIIGFIIVVCVIIFEIMCYLFDRDKIRSIKWFLKNKDKITNWIIDHSSSQCDVKLCGSYKKNNKSVDVFFYTEYDIISDKNTITSFRISYSNGNNEKLFKISGIISFFVKLYITRWVFKKIAIISMAKDLNLM